MEFILSRKSVRHYTEEAVSMELLVDVIKAGMSAPSGKNTKPWEFAIVTDRKILDLMAENLPYAKMLFKASAAIVVMGDVDKSSYWYLDCSAATQNILLAIEAKGLGGVWTATFPYEDRMKVVEEALNLPSNIKSLCVIPVGYPTGKEKVRDKFNPDQIHINKW